MHTHTHTLLVLVVGTAVIMRLGATTVSGRGGGRMQRKRKVPRVILEILTTLHVYSVLTRKDLEPTGHHKSEPTGHHKSISR